MNNRFTLLRLPNALRCRFTAASGILKQLQYIVEENYTDRAMNFSGLKT
ncbi:MAG: hypothetical protein LBJ00_14885 [Planctomycetaceae bacterium]|nr:hypothetical protein [Planctomycetaceae bacterium]